MGIVPPPTALVRATFIIPGCASASEVVFRAEDKCCRQRMVPTLTVTKKTSNSHFLILLHNPSQLFCLLAFQNPPKIRASLPDLLGLSRMAPSPNCPQAPMPRSEERRVGKEC